MRRRLTCLGREFAWQVATVDMEPRPGLARVLLNRSGRVASVVRVAPCVINKLSAIKSGDAVHLSPYPS